MTLEDTNIEWTTDMDTIHVCGVYPLKILDQITYNILNPVIDFTSSFAFLYNKTKNRYDSIYRTIKATAHYITAFAQLSETFMTQSEQE